MQKSTLLVVICMIIGIGILSRLGFWQVTRLAWKEDLIARVEAQLVREPMSIKEVFQTVSPKDLEENYADTINYFPVKLHGSFANEKPIFELTTNEGQSGWNVFSLFERKDTNTNIFINRGFIPYAQRESFSEISSASTQSQTIVGLLRAAQNSKPGFLVPQNDIEDRTFYYRSIEQMSASLLKNRNNIDPFYVDLGIPSENASKATIKGRPLAGTTRISFSNSHLSYALTWFGLAFTLLGVGSYFLYSRRQQN